MPSICAAKDAALGVVVMELAAANRTATKKAQSHFRRSQHRHWRNYKIDP
jgi:hypothetical protein